MDFIGIDKKIYNCIKNDFLDFTEIVLYKTPFLVTTGNLEGIDEETGELLIRGSNIDKSRKFEKLDNILIQKSDSVSINKIQNSIKESRKRSIDNLMGYVLCNRWRYWVTLTFSPKYVNREIDEEIKEKYKDFRRVLQYHCPNATYIAVPERHPKSGCLHFHILIGHCDLSKFMKKARNPKNGDLLKSFGNQIYNLTLFNFGFSTIVETNGDNLKIANYMSKYLIKDFGNIGYNKKSFYHSKNLYFKTKELMFFNEFKLFDNNLNDLLIENNKYKENDKLIVYRIKKSGI